MYTRAKKIISFFLALIMIFGAFGLNPKKVSAATPTFNIESINNGSFVVYFDSIQRNVDLSRFTANYAINGVQKGILTLNGISNISTNKYQITFTQFYASTEKQNISITLLYKDEYNDTYAKSFDYSIEALKVQDMKIITKENGGFTLEFNTSKNDVFISDFAATLYIDGTNYGTLPLTSMLPTSGYNGRYRFTYEPIKTTYSPQEIEIKIVYKNLSVVTSKYTLYPSGSIFDGIIGSEYDDLEVGNFIITNTLNGEVSIRFKNEIRSVLTKKDFSAKYYIDGVYNGYLDIVGVDEDVYLLGTDFTVYFDKLPSTEKEQSISILLFYEKDKKKRPEKGAFNIKPDEVIYETDITVEKVENFSDKINLSNIKIKEQGKNTIFPSNTSQTEYIKLELPEGFEFTSLNLYLTGEDGLRKAREFDVQYGTLKGEQTKRIILLGVNGVEDKRTKIGSLDLSKLQIKALEDAEEGEVKMAIGGCGIPYERIIVANYEDTSSSNSTDTSNNNNNNNGSTDNNTDNNNNNGNTDNNNGSGGSYVPLIVTIIQDIPKIIVNGVTYDLDTPPFVSDERLMLPVSHVAVAFGISVEDIKWDSLTNSVIIKDTVKNKTIKITVDSRILLINDSPVLMDTPAKIVNGRTFIPMRPLADALDFKIEWNAGAKMATLVR